MRALKTNKVFVSAHRAGNSAQANDTAHDWALNALRREGLSYRVVTGVWKGVTERSILLESTDAKQHSEHVDVALNMARLLRQDAVLEVCNDGHSILHDTGEGSGSHPIGTFREATREEALSQDGYTYDDASNRYYVVS